MPIQGFGSGGFGGTLGGQLKPPAQFPQEIVYDTWPEELPQFVLMDGYRESPADIVRRTPMEIGPAKQRRIFTSGTKKLPVKLWMSFSQVATFKNFYNNTLLGGSIPFQWIHPRTQDITTFKMQVMEEQTIEADDGPNAIISLILEVVR